MKAYKDFKYWFTFKDFDHLNVYTVPGRTFIGVITYHNNAFVPVPNCYIEHDSNDIMYALGDYLQRPEGILYNMSEEASVTYDDILTCAILGKTFLEAKDPDEGLARVSRCLEWLHKSDFYRAPASTRYHDNTEGGLLSHTMSVIHIILKLVTGVDKFSKIDVYSALLVAAVHDWCKIGMYIPYNKNVKDPMTGQWYQETAYKHNDELLVCLGHGVSSLALAQMFFTLTMEEMAAIRWHMGAWRVCPSEYDELQQSNENYPLVHALQFADQLSIVKY